VSLSNAKEAIYFGRPLGIFAIASFISFKESPFLRPCCLQKALQRFCSRLLAKKPGA